MWKVWERWSDGDVADKGHEQGLRVTGVRGKCGRWEVWGDIH